MMAAAVSPGTVSIVKGTVSVLREHGIAITSRFYENLFSTYPELRKQFNMDRQRGGVLKEDGVPKQVASLANAIMSYAKNIDHVERLLPVIERISHKHVSRGVSAAQYDKIGECLLKAMKDVLGDAMTDEIANAWAEAYEFLAKVFIATEDSLAKELSEKAGYSGFVEMVVGDIEVDEDGGKRLSLKSDEFGAPEHKAGQFVAVVIEKEGEEPTMTSMMTVRESVKDALWIHVPMSEEKASKYLLEDVTVGSVVKVSVPCGKGK